MGKVVAIAPQTSPTGVPMERVPAHVLNSGGNPEAGDYLAFYESTLRPEDDPTTGFKIDSDQGVQYHPV